MNPSGDSIDLGRYGRIILRHWLPGSIAFLSVLMLGAIATSLHKNIYQAEAKLQLLNNQNLSPKEDDRKALGGSLIPVIARSNSLATEAEVLGSLSSIEETIEVLQLQNAAGDKLSVSAFSNQLKIASLPGTDILKISYTSEDPQKAAEVVNTLIKNYLHNNQVVDKIEIVRAKEFLTEQLPKIEASLKQTETAIRQLKESEDFIVLTEQGNTLLKSQTELERTVALLQSQLVHGETQADYIRKQLHLTAQDTLISSQKDSSRETDSSKKVAPVQLELNRQLIQLEANNLGLQKQIDSLEQQVQSQRVQISQIPALEEKLNKLEREARSYQTSYDMLWEKLAEVKILENQTANKVRIIASAFAPTNPLYPRSLVYLAFGSFALLAGGGIAFLWELKDRSLKTMAETKNFFDYPWLGAIPKINKSYGRKLLRSEKASPLMTPELIVRDLPSSPESEAYRMLQSNLKFLHSQKAVKTIVITSSTSQEGKSTVAANLATAMAQIGNSVLLVDANLHNPKQHLIWETDKENGLSNIIAERLSPRLVVRKVLPNLDLITSGNVNLSSAEMSPSATLDSRRMRMLTDYWSEQYDFVVFDSPSLDMTADAPIMGRMVDGMLLVVRLGAVDRSQANFTKEILGQPGLNILGIVVNDNASGPDSINVYCSSNPNKQVSKGQNQNRAIDQEVSFEKEIYNTMTSLVNPSQLHKLTQGLEEEELQLAPITKLENVVLSLQQDLGNLTRLVREQEEELLNQRQKVKSLQRKANIAKEEKRFYFEYQLSQEQEKKRMLDETLVGQRRNLEKRRERLYQYQQILNVKRNSDIRSSN